MTEVFIHTVGDKMETCDISCLTYEDAEDLIIAYKYAGINAVFIHNLRQVPLKDAKCDLFNQKLNKNSWDNPYWHYHTMLSCCFAPEIY